MASTDSKSTATLIRESKALEDELRMGLQEMLNKHSATRGVNALVTRVALKKNEYRHLLRSARAETKLGLGEFAFKGPKPRQRRVLKHFIPANKPPGEGQYNIYFSIKNASAIGWDPSSFEGTLQDDGTIAVKVRGEDLRVTIGEDEAVVVESIPEQK